SEPGIDLTVFAGATKGGPKQVAVGTQYRYVHAPVRELQLGRLDLRFQGKQFAETRSKAYDLIILPWDAHYLSLGMAIATGRLNRIPVVLWGHGYSKKPKRIGDWLRNAYGTAADGIIVYSKTVAEMLVERWSFKKERVFVAQNAIDQAPIKKATGYWTHAQKELASFQKKWNIVPNKTVIFVSRLESENGVSMLLYALRLARQRAPEIKLVVVGDGREKSHLQTLARELGECNSVIFTGAIYDEHQLAPWMLSACLFCYPTNIGLSLMHAFGYALPVVTSNNVAQHNPEIEAFVHGVNGLFYAQGDVNDMTDKWLRIMNDETLRQNLSAKALYQVEHQYTLDKMVQGFREVFAFYGARTKKQA
ncbi:MAG: glycosyltransferase family 4 protein, partial [Nitrososphaera sp.]|nr:glycosyltransferase family 4 protein [Nitrososphaera sp.]